MPDVNRSFADGVPNTEFGNEERTRWDKEGGFVELGDEME
jgi:hypothetical protein